MKLSFNAKGTNNTVQAFWVSIGSLFAFGFSLVSSMILSRYFSKSDYGTYKQVIYVYHTLLTVFTLGLPKAFSYFLPRVDINQAKSIIRKITNLFFLLGLLFSLLLFFLSPQIAILLKNPDLKLALKVFSPVPLLMLPTMGIEGILATYKKTQFMTLYTVLTRVFMLICVAVPVIFFNGGYIQAIIGFVASSLISCLLALYLKYLPVRKNGNEQSSVKLKEILKFSLPLLFASLWGIIINSTDQFFISRFFGIEVFADFSNGSLELPFVGMVIGACSTVLMPVFSKRINDKCDPQKDILPLWTSVLIKTIKILYPLVLYFWFFADIVMIVLYGEKYANSGIFFSIKLIVNLFTLISFAPLLLSIGATKFYANVHMIGAIIIIIFEYLSVRLFNSPYIVTMVSVLCRICMIIVFLHYISKYFKIRFFSLLPLKTIAVVLLPSIIILVALRYCFVELIDINNILLLCLSFISFCIIYYMWTIIAKIDYLSIFKPLFK